MQLKVFLFHRVHPQRDLMWDPIDPLHFDYIIQKLSKQYSLVQFENFVMNGIAKKSDKPVASVVFDDGYRDFIQYSLIII